MKRTLSIFIVLLALHSVTAQQTTPPNQAPNPVPQPAPLPPSRPNVGGEPFQYNSNRPPGSDSNGFLPNRYTTALSNQPATNANPAGALPVEPIVTTNANLTVNFGITNTLSAMAPAQARNVISMQTGLITLQTLAMSLAPGQSMLVIEQSPQFQSKVQQVSTQIIGLAQGPKPSMDICQRLSFDLVRVSTRARVTPDGQLVLAVIINQISNCGSLSRSQVEDTINNAAVVLQSGGAPLALVHPVTCDLHSMVFELQPNL